MIEVHDVSFRYPETKAWALRNLSLKFSEGEVVLLAGPNGGGKSTLLKAILGVVPHLTGGELSGQVIVNAQNVRDIMPVQLAGEVGIVLQDPTSQITSLTVEDEVQFGLANLCLPGAEILSRSRMSLEQLGISHLHKTSVLALSGGQLQRLSLAALVAMQPEILILDEPVTSLDPHGVASVIETLTQLRHLFKLILISSHWLDPFWSLMTRLVVMNQGTVAQDLPKAAVKDHLNRLEELGVQIPQRYQIHQVLLAQGLDTDEVPVLISNWQVKAVPAKVRTTGQAVVTVSNISYRYPEGGSQPLQRVALRLYEGQHLALVGQNGSGKSTLSRILTGLLKPQTGQITNRTQKVGLMLQKPSLSFLGHTVRTELAFGWQPSESQLTEVLQRYDLLKYAECSPFHLSGGEQRRLALAVALVQRPDLLILDEPTAGLDAIQVESFLQILKDNRSSTVVHITHDPRIVGRDVDTVAVISNGQVPFIGAPQELGRPMIQELGYHLISDTLHFVLPYLEKGYPMLPEQLEVQYVGV
jgi:energy-coupling factor transporter ATP-binding protein EcfA2